MPRTEPADGRGRPALRVFPSADRAFRDAVERLFDGWCRETPGALDADAFEVVIRSAFPSASVRSQDSLASFDQDAVWYVNRREMAGVTAVDDSGAPGRVPAYSTARVAAMAGLPISVIVGWDEVDGLIRPRHTDGGSALYSRDDLEDILYAKRAFVRGASVEDVRAGLARRPRDRVGRAPRQAGSRRLLVLLAERDRYAAEFSEYFLRTEGYEVEVALSAEEAIDRATELQPDLSIVELLISGGSGPELCARLKSRPGALVLAISNLDDGDAALRAGADAFLVKPFEPLTFVSIVRDLLGDSAIVRRSSDDHQEATS